MSDHAKQRRRCEACEGTGNLGQAVDMVTPESDDPGALQRPVDPLQPVCVPFPYRFDLLDARTLLRAAQTMQAGADKYGLNSWRQIPPEDHVNHAAVHLLMWLAGDRSEHHLVHSLVRSMMAAANDTSIPQPESRT